MNRHLLSFTILLAGAGVLAAQPTLWLVKGWLAPEYQGIGLWVFMLVLTLGYWSFSSPIIYQSSIDSHNSSRFGIYLLVFGAVVRLTSQLLNINIIGAGVLALDCYALAKILRLDNRRRAISPSWLALLLLFALPIEPILQRSLGYLLQKVSAYGACAMLSSTWDVTCNGLRIMVADKDVLVDLPCSGARMLSTTLCFLLALSTLRRYSVIALSSLVLVSLLVCWLANSFRIAILALGIGHEGSIGFDVMAPVPHEIVGTGAAILAIGLVYLIASRIQSTTNTGQKIADSSTTGLDSQGIAHSLGNLSPVFALAFLLFTLSIGLFKTRPVDVSVPVSLERLPASIAGIPGTPQTLSAAEQGYFQAFGGGAAKAQYGPYSLLAVRTSSPLRHLHTPDVCLTGAGYQVNYVTAYFEPVPTAVYEVINSTGERWRIDLTFVAASGQKTHNIAEVVWHWFKQPNTPWTMLQRISPWRSDPTQRSTWDTGALRAFNVELNK